MRIKHLFRKSKSNITSAYARLSYERKARLYCVGTAKSGTHSIAAMFNEAVRSLHEPDNNEMIRKVLDISEARISHADLIFYIRKRDKKLCLDVDSSQLNFFLIDFLLEEFPDARFLLTVRDCYSWLDSFMNDSLRHDASEAWVMLRDYRFRSNRFSHPPEEHILKERGLYTLDGYLSYWASHNDKVLAAVPKDRLMVVRTNEITTKAYDIAAFAGLPSTSIRAEKSHSYKNPKKFGILRMIDEAYLETKVQAYCGPLMASYFPEIRSIDDVGI